MIQITQPVYNRIVQGVNVFKVKPKVITVHPRIYKRLCKELKHKVKTVYGMTLTNFYAKS